MERHQYLDTSAPDGFNATPWQRLPCMNNTDKKDGDIIVSTDPSAVDTTGDNGGVKNRFDDTFVENQDIVEFNTDQNANVATLDEQEIAMSSLTVPMKGLVDHSIKTFLERPYFYGSFLFSSTDAKNATIHTLQLYSDLFTRSYYKDKLRGLWGFKGTVNVRLQVNANRFAAGRLFLRYAPTHVDSPNTYQADRSLMTSTQAPRVNLDINTDTEATLAVPYISDQPFYEFSGNGFGYAGIVQTKVYSEYKAVTGTLNAECSLWVHFSDIELFWPGDAVAQSGEGSKRTRKDPKNEITGPNTPVANYLGKISKASGILARIPLLSSVAAPTSWATRIASDAAAAMGWCKPPTYQRVPVQIHQGANWTNVSGYDANDNLGALEDNKVSVMTNMAGSKVDQMSMRYVQSIPAWFRSFTVGVGQAPGPAFSFMASPGEFYETMTNLNNSLDIYATTPLKFLSTMFAAWRGTIKLRVVCVKTEFHTGRVKVAVNPSGTTPTLENSNYCYSKILDLKQATEWIIDIPFTCSSPYTTVEQIIDGHPGVAQVTFYVLNEIRAPDTVPTSVEFNVEVCGGEDFEFAIPVANSGQKPFGISFGDLAIQPAYNKVLSGLNYGGAWSQGGFEDGSSQSLTGHNPIGNAPAMEQTLEPAQLCIGERITSLKQLAARPGFIAHGACALTVVNVDAPVMLYQRNTGGVKVGAGALAVSNYDKIKLCYGFYRGSVVLKSCRVGSADAINFSMTNCVVNNMIFSSQNDTFVCPRFANYTSNLDPNNNGGARRLFGYTPTQSGFSTPTQGTACIQVPHYSIRPLRRTESCVANNGKQFEVATLYYDPYARLVSITHAISYKALAANKPNDGRWSRYYISGGDDFQCGFWIGSPFMYSDFENVKVPDYNSPNNYIAMQFSQLNF